MQDYEMVIGLEVHCELSTESKIFCGCSAKFGGEPNTHVCEVCSGMPGTLPTLNRQVVEYAVQLVLSGYARHAQRHDHALDVRSFAHARIIADAASEGKGRC